MTHEQRKNISEKTQITVGVLIAIMSAVAWVSEKATSLCVKVEVAQQSINDAKEVQSRMIEKIRSIDNRVGTIDVNVSEIKGELKKMNERKPNKYVHAGGLPVEEITD